MSKQDSIDKIELTKEEKSEYIDELLRTTKIDLMNCTVQESIYSYEYTTNEHLGKEKAGEGLAAYQQRIRYLKENIFALEEYKKNNDL